MKQNTAVLRNERSGCCGFHATAVPDELECDVVFMNGSQRFRLFESFDFYARYDVN